MSTDRCCIRKMWFVYTREYYSALKKNAICSSMIDIETIIQDLGFRLRLEGRGDLDWATGLSTTQL